LIKIWWESFKVFLLFKILCWILESDLQNFLKNTKKAKKTKIVLFFDSNLTKLYSKKN
jgi:hypothetical protein